ncbi:dTDP-4-dehydrorhamnose reductase [Thiomicrospira microaerophila]|uniref:dTDP-4-dehydrorhamnose reductase n=1 Tax=Thiomicrospira microaerophila TaxID=406020 RepID=UPI00200E5E22|nr:dTDP-4-dehydrorhamnose reductase [Thiomicrospira microaerophila]UQB43368.1 dTDP-4-dehydrorhamnose reductase [Thiomicrospira microaerophila]
MHKSLLVIGKTSQLGQTLQNLVNQSTTHTPQQTFTFTGRQELDLADPNSISRFFNQQRFDAIINCAAYTAVDQAENEPEHANQINHLAVKQLAEIAKKQHTTLIQLSTDYVFDGTKRTPYKETDPTRPINVYGLTKSLGEQACLRINPKGAIIRTSWLYSHHGHNFIKTMLRLSQQRDQLKIVNDQFGSPTNAVDLAQAIINLINNPQTQTALKIYHYANEGVCTWYDLAQHLFKLTETRCQLIPIKSQDYPTQAKRPAYSALNTQRIQTQLNHPTRNWQQALKTHLATTPS